MAKAVEGGLFAGVDRRIDEILGTDDRPKFGETPGFNSVTAAKYLSRPKECKRVRVLGDICGLLENNWAKTHLPKGKLGAPRRTWDFSPKHKAFEVPLERTIISISRLQRLMNNKQYPVWFNQIPVAAGLATKPDGKDAGEGKRCIDLVCRTAEGKYDFIELKCPRQDSKHASDTPLGAAFELLKYAAAYVFVVSHLGNLKDLKWTPKIEDETQAEAKDLKDHLAAVAKPWELLEAKEITLSVLAPRYVYHGYRLHWLAEEINEDLKEILASSLPGRRITFRFEYFDFDSLFANSASGSKTFGFALDRIPMPEDWSRLRAE